MPRALLLRHRSRDAAAAATGYSALKIRAPGQPLDPASRLLIAFIDGYRAFVSPWLPRACRFTPTCSEYARQAVERYGVWRGAWLALRRLGRCHPFHPGGHDPLV